MPTVATSPSSSTHSWSLEKRMGRSLYERFSGAAAIAVRDEGKGGDLRALGLAAHYHLEGCSGFRQGRRDIAHGDGRLQGRRKSPTGDTADDGAGAVGDFGALAGRRRRRPCL